MTIRQELLRLIYPIFTRFSSMVNRRTSVQVNVDNAGPSYSFYTLQGTLADGSAFDFNTLQNRKVLLVNLASNCGYTPQYRELEMLQHEYKERLSVLGFPANDFKGQEPGSDEEIIEFCRMNYAISFPLFQKNSVLKPFQNEIFKWLTDKKRNGWNDRQPVWNFSKYLIDEKGKLQYIFAPSVSPLSKAVHSAIS